ncbi:MAG: nuclear transport factor 2 family protein [Pseudomonadota bacterium]
MAHPEIQALADKEAIREAVYTYCRAVDRRDEELLQTCFHPGATHEHGDFKGRSTDFIGFAFKFLSVLRETQHLVGNILIDLRGETAVSEAYWTAFHRIPASETAAEIFGPRDGEQDWIVGGRYIDRFEKRDGVWRIADRLGVHDWQRFEPAADGGFHQLPESFRGEPSTADRIYGRLRG